MGPSPDDEDQQCSLDDIFKLLADAQCRQILTYLIQNADRPVPLEALLEELMSQTDRTTERERLLIRLHHLQLPKLVDYGMIEYNESLQLISYTEQPRVETLLQSEQIGGSEKKDMKEDGHDS